MISNCERAFVRAAESATRSAERQATPVAEKAASMTADVRVDATIAGYAQHFRLTDAPQLVSQLDKLDKFWGRDTTRRLARDHQGHRAGFLVDLVSHAESQGYPDLRGLQDALPKEWLSRPHCPFCHVPDMFAPKGSVVAESPSFVAAPNIRQLFKAGEGGDHVMVFAKHHRSTPSALPAADRQELVGFVRRVKAAMQADTGKPVSIFANGEPGAASWIQDDVDSHSHMQLFSGDTTIVDQVLAETGLGREDVLPVNSFDDYFKLYDAGKLRDRYILTMDAQERGAVILIGDRPTAGGLAMRNARIAVGLPPAERGKIDPDPGRALAVAASLQKRLAEPQPADARSLLAAVPVPPAR